ncbi:hypothetical protein ACUOCP_30330, partial [Escherichia sp. R-CC3]
RFFNVRTVARHKGQRVGDNLAYIATSMVNLRLAQERYPDVQFHQTREH